MSAAIHLDSPFSSMICDDLICVCIAEDTQSGPRVSGRCMHEIIIYKRIYANYEPIIGERSGSSILFTFQTDGKLHSRASY